MILIFDIWFYISVFARNSISRVVTTGKALMEQPRLDIVRLAVTSAADSSQRHPQPGLQATSLCLTVVASPVIAEWIVYSSSRPGLSTFPSSTSTSLSPPVAPPPPRLRFIVRVRSIREARSDIAPSRCWMSLYVSAASVRHGIGSPFQPPFWWM